MTAPFFNLIGPLTKYDRPLEKKARIHDLSAGRKYKIHVFWIIFGSEVDANFKYSREN